jgi:hypothetical protein
MYLNVLDDINYIDLYTGGVTIVLLAQINNVIDIKVLQQKIYDANIQISIAKYDINPLW